ncbi:MULTISPECIES: hypothetical protein [unclassified Rhodanobacter]|uniref:hypothetical protein n=1 Tax=unclassified Rhodanobacter TaxID=2621553 RepID=UPI001BDECB3B|nr:MULTISPECIES: hypothetical protein [unclassified Rhodanobacter]MBT2142679.1 hypothetical protein [Rhodanobacter sp. LX-99]MBT2148248.1 hypothetical protein [Rhodanobacter sp. LX-100]
MSTEVIREFLVSLGYKVDSTGERKFVDGVKVASTEVAKLGLAAAAAAASVAAAVVKMASSLEDLYFMSQRTKASAANIQSFGYAASQMGSSVEGARGSIEGLAKFLRENPGGEGLLGSIGVQTRDVNGALRDTTDIMQDIGKRLRNMPQYRAISYANVFGIDYKTLMVLEQGVGEFSGRYQKLLQRFGLSVDDATKKSHELMVGWRDMKATAGILGTIVGTTLIGAFDELKHRWDSLDFTQKENIKTTGKWAAGIVAGLALVMGGPVVWIAALAAGVVALWDDYQVWKEGGKSLIDWKNWKTEIDLATGGITGLINTIKTLERWREKAHDGLGKFVAGKAAAINNGTGPYDARQQNSPLHNFLKNFAYYMGFDPSTGEKIPDRYMTDPEASAAPPSAGSTRGIRNNNPGNIKYGEFARRHGATGQDSAGFAIFPSAAAGLGAINANLSSYGRQGINTPSAIAHRWSTTDQDAYTQRLAGMFGGDANKSLNLNDPAVLNALRNGIILQENGKNPYSAEMLGGSGTAAAPGQTAGMNVDQTVTINMHGVDKAKDAADAVVSGINGANDRLVRNLKGAAS